MKPLISCGIPLCGSFRCVRSDRAHQPAIFIVTTGKEETRDLFLNFASAAKVTWVAGTRFPLSPCVGNHFSGSSLVISRRSLCKAFTRAFSNTTTLPADKNPPRTFQLHSQTEPRRRVAGICEPKEKNDLRSPCLHSNTLLPTNYLTCGSFSRRYMLGLTCVQPRTLLS